MVIACLKRLLPVGLNVFGGRELDIVQQCKEKFLAKEVEEKIREFIRERLDVPVKVMSSRNILSLFSRPCLSRFKKPTH